MRTLVDREERYPSNTQGDSMTQQHFVDECDIHNIMGRFACGGTVTQHVKSYGEQPTMDLHQVMSLTAKASQFIDPSMPVSLGSLNNLNFVDSVVEESLDSSLDQVIKPVDPSV